MSRLNLQVSRVFTIGEIEACFANALDRLKKVDATVSISDVMETVNVRLQDEMKKMLSEAIKEMEQSPQPAAAPQAAPAQNPAGITPPWMQQAEFSAPTKKTRKRTAPKV